MNRIRGLQSDDGSVATNNIEMGNIARDYFVNLFEFCGTVNMDHILLEVPCCISKSMNQCLLATYTKEEIIEALNGMGPTKASGPVGFPVIFYQKYWNIIGKDTSNFCLGILNVDRLITDNVLLAYEVLNVWYSIEAKRYMGLPNMVRQRKKAAFQALKDRLKRDLWEPQLTEGVITSRSPGSTFSKSAL
ncbi:hypothetical protein PVK06_005929 [Gossypium arboreum]|uniref:Reverse transcriptase n=1 Tax=Gossypium arboreum TaxID=29729 RepID=A0ABR0QX64_GOSAR|nr:hypothetical protein PVK06_005929 [Gossypium arboreum]